MADKKKKRFNIFDWMNRDGKGVEKGEPEILKKPDVAGFFKLFWRKLNKIFSINLFLVFGNIPIFFSLFALTGYLDDKVSVQSDFTCAALAGVSKFDSAVSVGEGVIKEISVASTLTNVFYILGALALFTFGIVKVGTTYIMRNMLKGEPVFMWTDFWYVVKRNLRQAIIYGIIDVVIMFFLAYDLLFFFTGIATSGTFTFLLFLSVVMMLYYSFMRMYSYLMLITFDLSIFKIFKNSMIFALLGFKRNFVAFIGVAIVVFLNIWLVWLYPPVGIILPVIITVGLVNFIWVYAAYPKIKEVMIDPYYGSDATPAEE